MNDINQTIDDIAKIHQKQQTAETQSVRHTETQLSAIQIQETILHAFQLAINYLDGHVGRSEVINFPHAIATPDVEHVVKALQPIYDALKTHENTDVEPIVKVMQDVLSEVKQIPKEHPDQPEVPENIDYSDQLTKVEKALGDIQTAIKAQKLHVEAPNVTVPAPNVHVDAPDLKSLEKGQNDAVKAIKGIKIPEPASTASVEKLIKRTNSILQEVLETLPGGSGGGSGLATPYVQNGLPAFPELYNGALPVITARLTERFDYSSNPIYVGSAPLGSSEADAVWYIEMFDLTDSSNATGKKAVNASWSDRDMAVYE